MAGVPAVVCLAIKQWEDEVLCLRELLGVLQTLCWDKQCVRSALQTDIVSHLIEFSQVNIAIIRTCFLQFISAILNNTNAIV